MTVEITSLHSTFYILPAIRIWHEKLYDGGYCRLSLELLWFNRSLDFVFIDK